MDRIFFNSWDSLGRIAIIGVCAYVVLIFFLRITGKRTLSEMNAFDFVVTVALGSTLATVLLSKDVTLADGAVAFAMLIGLQYVVTWSSVRVRWVKHVVTGEPAMLLYRGAFLREALVRTRVTENEVRAAVRSNGMLSLDDAEAVVLETDGSFSVLKRNDSADASSLEGVQNQLE